MAKIEKKKYIYIYIYIYMQPNLALNKRTKKKPKIWLPQILKKCPKDEKIYASKLRNE